MSAEIQETELQAFVRYVQQRLHNGLRDASPEESLRQFRAHREQMREFIDVTQLAVEQVERGESRPVDSSTLKFRVRERLRNEGIADAQHLPRSGYIQ